jgi:putative ABC transport system ATP-binding protein
VIAIMQRLNSELGTTFLISSHDARVIAHARRILTLRDGQLVNDEQRDTHAPKAAEQAS